MTDVKIFPQATLSEEHFLTALELHREISAFEFASKAQALGWVIFKLGNRLTAQDAAIIAGTNNLRWYLDVARSVASEFYLEPKKRARFEAKKAEARQGY